MSYRNREIETKLVVLDRSLQEVNEVLRGLYEGTATRSIFGSSTDTYWIIQEDHVRADFIRMRERDGIRQITVKGKDRGTNLNRLEIDIDSTSSVASITALLTAAHGPAAGTIGKTYYVYWPEKSEHTTICCYSVQGHDYPHTIVEVETISQDHMLELETEVVAALRDKGMSVDRAPGSLFEMFITRPTRRK